MERGTIVFSDVHSVEVIYTTTDGRLVWVFCRACRGALRIELKPSDAPHLAGRIENITDEDES
jgi:hypothetical protein